MKPSTGIRLSLALGLLIPAGMASAAPLPFSDNFDSIATTALNAPSTGWVTTSGTVDSIASGDFGITCAGSSGGCVDLDGSTTNSGLLLTNTEFELTGGQQYRLSFDLSGNQRTPASFTDSLAFGLNNADNNSLLASGSVLDVAWNAAFQTYELIFTAASDVSAYIFFSNIGPNNDDNIGPVLDNVRLAAVPIPAAGWLLISGLVGLVGVARRRQSGQAVAA